MNVEISAVPFNSICKGCLSVDRNLKLVKDPDTKRFFESIVEPLLIRSDATYIDHPLALCWECMAIIRKILKYQKQVQNAQEYLVRFKLQYSTSLPCLSSLTVHTVPEFTIKLEDCPSPRVPHSPIPISPRGTSLVARDITLTERNEAMTESVMPLTFIKVENDDDDYGEDAGSCFVDEGADDGCDDKDLKTVFKTDSFTKKEKSKSKRRSKRKTEIEFNDSDDEPLKKRTEEKIETQEERKKKGRRKKKEDSASTGKPKAVGKREKPAGVVDNVRVSRKLERLSVSPGQLEMIVLSWEQVEEERQKALVSPAYTRHEYRCEDCAVGFNHRFKLDNHMKKHDPSAGALECAACRVRCRDAHALCAHRRRHRVRAELRQLVFIQLNRWRHLRLIRWRCVSCGALWSRAETAADHVARRHGARAPAHACRLCAHVATSLGKLRSHMKNHAERQNCELCGKSFRDRASLRTHLFIHKGEKEYSCPQCGKQFLFKKAMEVHLVTHDAPAHLYCHQCDVNFKNRMSFYQHMKYNLKHIDPAMLKHACSLCDKKFAKAARLQEHMIAVHLKATPVSCTMPGCNFACSSRPVLRTHVRMVHRNLRARRDHVCHTCGKAYATKKTLEGHMRSHTGERPFACAYCSSTFAYEAALYNHNKLVHLKAKSTRRASRPAHTSWPLPTATIDQSDLTSLPR